MGSVMQLVSVVGILVCTTLCIFCVGSGLYVVSVWVEEHSRSTKKTIILLIYSIAAIHMLLLIDGFPLIQTLVSLLGLVLYSSLLKDFPMVNLLSFSFIATCLFSVTNHIIWFIYFLKVMHIYSLLEIGSFMLICIWLLPLALMISIDSFESSLPKYDAADGKKKRNNLFQSFVNRIAEKLQ